MKVSFHRHFAKDLIKIGSSNAKERIKRVILELEEAGSLESFPQIKAMKGEGAYLRIRVGDYRIGLRREDNGDGVVLRQGHAPQRDLSAFPATLTGFRHLPAPAGLRSSAHERVRCL